MKKLFWLCQGSEYVWSFYMFDRLLMMLWVLNLRGFWIWDGFIWKGCTKFWICLNMAQYASIMSEYALMSLIMPENGWILLDVTKYAWKCLNKLFWLCQGSQYTLSSQIFDRALYMPQALNMPGFWIFCDIVIITLLVLELMLS